MTTPAASIPSEAELDELVACTLADADRKSQRDRWINLGNNFGIARIATNDGLRLTFYYRREIAAELNALVAIERECCAWASWSVERDAQGPLVMTVRAQGDGVRTLHTMFTQARPWRVTRP